MANTEEAKRLYDKGLGHYRAGEYEEAIDALSRAREQYAAAGERQAEAEVLNDMGVVCIQLENWDRAQHYLDEALTIRLALPDRSGQGITLGNLGMMYARQDNDERAADCYRQAITIFQELGDRGNEKAVSRQLSKLKLQHGQVMGALGEYEQDLAGEEAAGGPQKLARRLFRMLGRLTGGGGAETPREEADQDEETTES